MALSYSSISCSVFLLRSFWGFHSGKHSNVNCQPFQVSSLLNDTFFTRTEHRPHQYHRPSRSLYLPSTTHFLETTVSSQIITLPFFNSTSSTFSHDCFCRRCRCEHCFSQLPCSITAPGHHQWCFSVGYSASRKLVNHWIGRYRLMGG